MGPTLGSPLGSPGGRRPTIFFLLSSGSAVSGAFRKIPGFLQVLECRFRRISKNPRIFCILVQLILIIVPEHAGQHNHKISYKWVWEGSWRPARCIERSPLSVARSLLSMSSRGLTATRFMSLPELVRSGTIIWEHQVLIFLLFLYCFAASGYSSSNFFPPWGLGWAPYRIHSPKPQSRGLPRA